MTFPSTLGSFPSTDLDEQDRMGPLFTETPDIDFWWNRAWPNGAYTSAVVEGWEGASYITPLEQVGGRDGAFTGPHSLAPKILNINALIVAPTDQILYQMLQQIRRILGPQASGTRQPIVYERHDWITGERWAMVTHPTGGFDPRPVSGTHKGGNAAAISFSLVAANPLKFRSGAFETAEVGLENPALLSGRTYDKTFPYSYGGGGTPGGQMTVVNSGDQPAWPMFTIIGAADKPIITNVTSLRTFQVDYTLATGEVVTINSSTGAITPANVRLLGAPFPLLPGVNTIRWRTASNAYNADARLRLEWRSTAS